MKITTDNKWRPLLDRSEVSLKFLENELDWCKAETGYIWYKGWWYHISEFILNTKLDIELKDWDGYMSETVFSGVLVKVDRECESVIMGSYNY